MNILIKGRFFGRNLCFIDFFLLKKGEKILTIFFFKISKQVVENLILPNGGGYLVNSKKIFNWVLK